VRGGRGSAARTLRLFFALWPGDAHRAALAEAAAAAVAGIPGRQVPTGNLHVTLVFLGAVPARTFAQLVEVGGRQSWPTVELGFQRLEYWAKPKVVVAMPDSVPESGREIVDRLWRAVVPLGFEREARPWRPHLTLLRQVRRPPPENLAIAPVPSDGREAAWRLAIVESSSHPDGVRYRALAEWGLGDCPL
jgi:RNA 2',3'-cyclic 3'-phosphodiesterase